MIRDRKRLAPISYLLAVVFLLATFGWLVVNRRLDLYAQIGLSLAVALVAVGILLDPARVRQALTGRQARHGSNAVLVSLAFTGILVVLCYLAFTNPKQADLTEDKEYTLTTETKLALAQLTQPVTLVGFYTPDLNQARDSIRPLLEQYRLDGNGKVRYEFIDPRADPVSADRYGVTRDGSIVVVLGDHSRVAASSTEEEITGAIVSLVNPEDRKVYFLVGHGEHDLASTDSSGYSEVKRALESKNYKVATLNLVSDPAVPKDALAIVIAGPTIAIPDAEVKILQAYVDGGGSLIVLLEPTAVTKIESGKDPLVDYLQTAWGVQVQDDLVVDTRSSLPLTAIADKYGDNPITARLRNLVSYFPTARSLSIPATMPASVSLTPLVLTGTNSWGKTDMAAVKAGTLDFAAGTDLPGPLTIVVAGENPAKNARLVVFGDSDFAANADFYSYANGDLVVNSIDWAARQEKLINLTPKQNTPRFVTPPSTQATGVIFLVTVILIPGAAVGMGVYQWASRRRHG